MKNIYLILILLTTSFGINAQIAVDCSDGPVNTIFCYDDNANEEFTYVSSDGFPLNLVINSGSVEEHFDQFIVLDSDGTVLYNGFGNGGDLSGLNFQSSGDTITVQVISDFLFSCQDDENIEPIDLQVSCATCINPDINFELVDDCINAPQFFVEAEVVDLGSANDITITDNQGNSPQTTSSTGVFSFGPYPNGTVVELVAQNNQDINCQVVSQEFSQDICTTNLVDCATGPVNTSFCYGSLPTEEITYVSNDGSVLNLIVNSGFVQEHAAVFIVLDSDGTVLYNGFGDFGDLSGLSFQSSGDTITVLVTSFFGAGCQNNEEIDPIELQVSCATCENPDITFELAEDCLNGPQFFVEADVVDLGSADNLTITDNLGNTPQTVTSAGIFSFGPYPNGTLVELTAVNNQDANCQIISEEFTQDVCTTNLVDCAAGPLNTVFCYDDNANEEYTYISSDGFPLNLVINSGGVEEHFDQFIVLDTDGSVLYNGFGNGGDLSGLNFQSSGDSITVQVISDFLYSCQDNENIEPIDLQVSCATCINPDINFELVDDCLNAPQFFVEADVADLGSAEDLTFTDNQGSSPQTIDSTGVLSFGPYPNGTVVELTAQNNQDANCQVVSQEFSQDICTTNLVDCAAGPVNTSFCYGSGDIEELNYVSSDGSVLNLVVNSGFVQEHFTTFIVVDSDGTELYNGFGNQGDLSGLNFQSTGDTITVLITSFFGAGCQNNDNIDPIELQVSCATCENPEINFELVDDCLNGPQFFVEADVIDLGSAEDLSITDNQGNPPQTASSSGVFNFGPYPNGTVVELTAQNNQDANCQIISDEFTQDICTTNLVDCAVGPLNTVFCYGDNANEEFTYVSSDGSLLSLVVNSGSVEANFDQFRVLDSDGTELYNGFGNDGDLTGLSLQSSGDTLTVQIISDFLFSCEDDESIDPIDFSVSCSFFNLASGHVFYDELGNGCDINDHELSNYMVNISDGSQDISVAVDENGQYFAELDPGTYTLSVLNVDDNFTADLATQTITLTEENQIVENIDFCITTANIVEDLSIEISPLDEVVPGSETVYKFFVTNNGTHVASQAQISFGYNGNLQSFVAGTESPAVNTNDLLMFNINNIEPFSTKSFEITMANAWQPTLNEGEILSFNTEVTAHENETNIEDNTAVHQQTVVNSHSSNDVMVVQGDEIVIDRIDQYLNYRVRFQNEGAANATDVRITSIISDKLDWTTFHPTSSSHDYRVEIIDGEINYYFNNINLPYQAIDGENSKGYITYKIKPKSDIQIGDIIENTANIYIDSDFSFTTNTARTTVVGTLSVDNFNLNEINIYPNPVENLLNINRPAEVNVRSMKLFDLKGKLIETYSSQNVLDMSQIQSGIYILSVETDNGTLYEKVIKK